VAPVLEADQNGSDVAENGGDAAEPAEPGEES
jgi:hypothetical protein